MQNRSLSQAIRIARLKHELTQAELADRIGVSQGTISFWENDTETPTVEHLIALALVLPEILEDFEGRERALLQRVLQLEHELFGGGCSCKGCGCSSDKTSQQASKTVRRSEKNRMKIAITGKGGVGKTTIAGALARLLAQDQQLVLALDADSNPNLALTLGIPPEQISQVKPIPAGLTEWREDATGKAYVHLRQSLPQIIDDYGLPAPDGVRLLITGEVEHAGVGCRCEAHAVARGITGQLMAEANVVVLDMEAGLEHLGRGTTEHVDILLIVVEPYYRALETATRIRDLAMQLELPIIGVVANRVRTPQEQEAIVDYCRKHNLDLIAAIPFDEMILTAEQRGLAPLDYAPHSPAIEAIGELAIALCALHS